MQRLQTYADHEVREERRGEHRLYQAFGDGAVDLVFVPGFVSHIELAREEPILNQEQYTSLTAGNISLEFSCRAEPNGFASFNLVL